MCTAAELASAKAARWEVLLNIDLESSEDIGRIQTEYKSYRCAIKKEAGGWSFLVLALWALSAYAIYTGRDRNTTTRQVGFYGGIGVVIIGLLFGCCCVGGYSRDAYKTNTVALRGIRLFSDNAGFRTWLRGNMGEERFLEPATLPAKYATFIQARDSSRV